VGIEIRELKDGAAMLDEGGGVRALETTLKKIKLADKKGALDSLAKILGMMKDRVEHSGRVTLEDLIVGKNEATS
jgi:hypothetical protein